MKGLLDSIRQGCQPWPCCRILALDFELSDLDPRRGEILSIGAVEIEHGEIQLASCRYWTVQPKRGVGQSAVIHRLFDSHLQQGDAVDKVLPELAALMKARILLAHNAAIEHAFLSRYLSQLGTRVSPILMLDTLQIEQRRLLRQPPGLIQPGELTLRACRRRYHLPDHHEHHALSDALACAELFLAQASAVGTNASLRVFQPRRRVLT